MLYPFGWVTSKLYKKILISQGSYKTGKNMKYLLHDNVGLSIIEGNLFVSVGNKVAKFGLNGQEMQFLCSHKGPFTTQDFNKNKRLFNILKKHMVKIDNNSWVWNYIGTRFEKSAFYFLMHGIKKDPIQTIKSKKIMIVGAGGIGAILLEHLSAAGANNIVVIDFDKVSATNLNRQYTFSEKDVGKSKLKILAQKFKNIKTIRQKISSEADFKVIYDKHKPDIVINCADTPPLWIELFLLSPMIKTKTAYIACGVGLNSGTIGPFLKNKNEKQAELKSLKSVADRLLYTSTCFSSFGPTNSIIADIVAQDVCNYLVGLPTITSKKRTVFDFTKMSIIDG